MTKTVPVQANSKTDALDGVTVADLDQEVRQQLQLPDNVQGVVVTDVDPDSNSADAGLQPNDVIVEINHHPVTNADRAVELCKQARGNQILLKIWRARRRPGRHALPERGQHGEGKIGCWFCRRPAKF